jgi:hypothetical protein
MNSFTKDKAGVLQFTQCLGTGNQHVETVIHQADWNEFVFLRDTLGNCFQRCGFTR